MYHPERLCGKLMKVLKGVSRNAYLVKTRERFEHVNAYEVEKTNWRWAYRALEMLVLIVRDAKSAGSSTVTNIGYFSSG